MTGEEAWRLLAPTLLAPTYEKGSIPSSVFMEAYVILFVGTQLFDNWVANGKPESWQEKLKGRKK